MLELAYLAAAFSLLVYGAAALTNGTDSGSIHGRVLIANWCDYPVRISSVGAYKKGGDPAGKPTIPDPAPAKLEPQQNWTEDFRESCGLPDGAFNRYCPDMDKISGEGVAIKIFNGSAGEESNKNISQLEYALVQDPKRGDTFKRLNYDISLLDCAIPPNHIYAQVNDFHAAGWNRKKVAQCPGYQGGLAVLFTNTTEQNCPPIRCNGSEVCLEMYNLDKTRKDEPSLACNAEFYGTMAFHMCWGGIG